ncbi:MAG: choice-of-anchor J domain-containing protein [Thermoflavifilum sp.]|nr:choice-of-anchor J domain-containing protein [Thermoflavifilum sp.]
MPMQYAHRSWQIWLLLFFGWIGMGTQTGWAQRKCGFDLATQQALQRNPKLAAKINAIEGAMRRFMANPRLMLRMDTATDTSTVIIPVVVHIVLQNPNQVSDSQVFSQITVLNQDYQALNADTSKVPAVWKPIIGRVKFQYVLAKRTPTGLPTNGIDRVQTTVSTFSINNACAEVKHANTGGADAWDTKSYLNIWVCNLPSGYLGVTTQPGLYPADEDGVVITTQAFGTIGNLDPEFNLGRTATHEVGHYWNLLHPWGSGSSNPDCTADDSVADTPPQAGPLYGCYPFPTTDHCSPDSPGVMIMNYMGYADDSCMYMFTHGQVLRMLALLNTFRSSLLSSQGAEPIQLEKLKPQLLRILQPANKICDATIQPVLVLRNYGYDSLYKAKIIYYTEDSIPHQYLWTGRLGTFDSTQVVLPAITNTIGNHLLTAFAIEPNDSTNQQYASDTIRQAYHLDPTLTSDFTEGFEENTFPPPYWEVVNPDNSYTWEHTSVASHSGMYSVVMRNLDYMQNGPMDDLISPVINVSQADSAFLFFYVAAGLQSNPYGNNQYWDTLEVLISTDCGQTGTIVYKKWGKYLMTDSVPTSSEFIPTASQWRRDSINLTPFIKKGNLQIIFRNITNFENNIYLDDIQLQTRPTNPNLKKEKVLVVPNPTTGEIRIEFLELSPDFKGVNVFNNLGQKIGSYPPASIVNNQIAVHLSGNPSGTYYVELVYSRYNIVKKVLLVH